MASLSGTVQRSFRFAEQLKVRGYHSDHAFTAAGCCSHVSLLERSTKYHVMDQLVLRYCQIWCHGEILWNTVSRLTLWTSIADCERRCGNTAECDGKQWTAPATILSHRAAEFCSKFTSSTSYLSFPMMFLILAKAVSPGALRLQVVSSEFC